MTAATDTANDLALLMPPPPPRTYSVPRHRRAVDVDELTMSALNSTTSDAGSLQEEAVRRVSASASTTSQRRKRRRRHSSRGKSSASVSSERPLSDYNEHGVVTLTASQRRNGVFRSDVSASASHSNEVLASLDIAQDALRRAGVPHSVAEAALSEAVEDRSFVRNFAVPPDALYDPGACPICEETLSFIYDDASTSHAMAENLERGATASTSAATLMRKRRIEVSHARSARMAIAREDQRKHELLFRLESLLRTRIADDRIARIMLRLRRNMIERDLERFGIKYVAWTLDMITSHINEKNRHQWDPLREALADHQRLIRVARKMEASAFVPSVTHPGTTLTDTRVVSEIRQFAREARASRKHVIEMQDAVDPHTSSSLRALTEAVVGFTVDVAAASLTTDPEHDAGTIAMGGDARTDATIDVDRRAPGSAAARYIINGL